MYRIVEIIQSPDASELAVEVRRFDSAYDAVDALREARDARDQRAWCWYLLDDLDRILFGPDDLADELHESPDLPGRLERCLSCERWTDANFCSSCLERSRQRFLIPGLDDLGVAG